MRGARAASIALAAVASIASARGARAGEVASYAIVIGNNAPPTSGGERLARLRYADDDAVRYYQLLSRFAETRLLAVLDDDTQRRYRGLASVAEPPTLRNLEQAVNRIARRMAADRARGRRSVFYVVFSGHGARTAGGEPFLAMTDGELTQDLLYDRVLARLPGAYGHLIIDACHAAGVVGVRGDGFFQREVEGATTELSPGEGRPPAVTGRLARLPHVGVILSTTLGQEAHEWSEIEAGVFSHELLSGLVGPADVNRDSVIEYSEAQAFVAAANRNVRDPRAIPQVVARPPSANQNAPLVSLAQLSHVRRLEGDPSRLGHFHVELANGQRYLDAHLTAGGFAWIAIPADGGAFLRTESGEAAIPERGRVALADLRLRQRAVASRGSIAATYRAALFSAPYGVSYYQGYVDSTGAVGVRFDDRDEAIRVAQPAGERPGGSRRATAIGFAAVAGVSAIAAATTGIMAWDARKDYQATDLQRPAHEAEQRFERYRTLALVSGAAAIAAGVAAIWLWPKESTVRVAPVTSARGEHGLSLEMDW